MAKTSRNESNEETPKQPRKLNPVWTPQPGPQVDAILADWCPILLYGGAKYGGKSDYLLGDYLMDVPKYREHWQGILFRRSYKQFTDLITRSKQLYPRAGAEWKKGDSEWHFKEGSILRFRYLESLDDLENYWGHSYPWIGVDEVGEWEDPKAFFRLFTLLRYGNAPIPTKRLRASANPGGAGHAFVKEYFIDPAPTGYRPIYDELLKKHRIFIPASIDDNQIGLMNDPDYEANMNRAGSPELVKAWRYGIWDIIAGAFYPEISDKHFIDPIRIPDWWTRFCCMDWGACGEGDPFWIGWIAISDGCILGIPKGALVVYREYYGKGLPKVTVSQVAPKIIEFEVGENIQYRVAGGDIEQQRGTGTSIYEIFTQYGLHFKRADRRRLDGAQAVREHLVGKNKVPDLLITKNCPGLFGCLQTLQHDPDNGADCLQSNDDPYDGLRYGVMSRPYITNSPAPLVPPQGIEALTFAKALELEGRYRQYGR